MRIAIVIFILLSVMLVLYMIRLAHRDTITYEQIFNEKISQAFSGFTIFFIADIHRRKINHQTIQKIKQRIDLVLIGGDLLERNVPLQRVRQNILTLKQWNKPIYFVWGNNDYETNTNEFIQILLDEDVIILEDSIINMYKEDEKINLIGFDYYKDASLQPIMDWKDVDQSFTIVLTHKPSAFDDLLESQKEKIDLVLAGHTHGGQIRIFGFGLYEKGGLYSYKRTKIFITEGYGYTLLPFRLQTEAQCHIITLFHE